MHGLQVVVLEATRHTDLHGVVVKYDVALSPDVRKPAMTDMRSIDHEGPYPSRIGQDSHLCVRQLHVHVKPV